MSYFTVIGSTDWHSYYDLAGGTIQQHKAHVFKYTSDNGFKVTLHGSGFRYDGQGIPIRGTVTDLTVVKDGEKLATYTSLSTSLVDFCTLALGVTSGAPHAQPDLVALYAEMRGGNDVIDGNELGKSISGYDGNDTIYGNGGDDWLSGGRGVDSYYGGTGLNGIYFDDHDLAEHGAKVDLTLATGNIIDDGFGNTETAIEIQNAGGTAFADNFIGNGASNSLWGDSGNDSLAGGGGSDFLVGEDNNDVLSGGAAGDQLIGGAGDDSLNGGSGVDFALFWDVVAPGQGVKVNLGLSKNQVIDDGYGNAETLVSIEGVGGSEFSDTLTGNAIDNELGGNGGRDLMLGGDGDDTVYGGQDADTLTGGDGDDDLYGGFDADTLTGRAGVDEFLFLGNETGFDAITDFAAGTDKISLNAAWGTGLSGDVLIADQFRAAAGATNAITSDQRVIFNTTTDSLYFDADGVGGIASVKFAELTNGATVTIGDFWLFT